jgi:mitogen-activated protein kinase 1/3
LGDKPNKIAFLEKSAKGNGANFDEFFPEASEEAKDFIKKILTYDPDKRMTVNEALEHPFLSELYCPSDEPTMEKPLTSFHFDFEFYKLSRY